MTTIVERLLDRARDGDREFLITDERSFSWAEIADASLRLASHLRLRSIGKGDHVALLCSNRPAFLVAWFAIAARGAVSVPLNTGLVGDGLRYALRQSDSKALVVEEQILDAKRGDLADLLPSLDVVAFRDDADLFQVARAEHPDTPAAATGSDPCTIIYTSGTTGRPKGVVNSHTVYLACGRATTAMVRLRCDDRIMVFLPLFHANPQMYAVMSALETGAALVLRPKFSVSSFLADVKRFRATGFTYVGTVLSMLAARLTERDRDHALRFCVGGGAPADVWRSIEERFGVKVHELYGMTEIGGWVTGNTVEYSNFGTCGLPRYDMEVRIFDENDCPVAARERGEIVVRPREPFTILSGYYKNPEAMLAATRNLWFHTGDCGWLDNDGYLHFHGRLKELIRRAGENISPVEIEIALLDHPDIADAAIVGVPDPILGEEIKAVIVARRPITPDVITNALAGRVPDFMMPRYVEFVTSIPKTETQKIQRHLLQTVSSKTFDLRSPK